MKNTFFKKSTSCILFVLLFAPIFLKAQTVRINEIPYPIEIKNNPVSFIANDSLIRISAKGKTNLFNNPNGIYKVQDAPMLLFEPKGDFTLKAKVSGNLQSIYDVAALVVYQDENLWAKFCYENSVEKIPTIVSVVTRKYSDDCNSLSTSSYAYMSIVRKGEEFSFFYSPDDAKWQLIRHFRLELTGILKVGFAAHGSRGDGFTANFTEIKYLDKALEDMRQQ